MGVVYRASHRETGDRVAVKTVRGFAADTLSSLRREIHALRRIRLPGVVRVVDDGFEDGAPWYAMELLRGETLHDVLRARTSENAQFAANGELPRMLRIMRRLCVTLGLLHNEGIVHGDLKPENVVLLPGDRPVLVDFGLAGHAASGLGREVVDDLLGLAGTPSYMAPEQIYGQSTDARTDLYSVGCILFELLTGHPPFVRARPSEVLMEHISSPAPPPSALVAGVPPALDGLVLSLLQKEQARRPGHVLDVIADLERLGVGPDPDEPELPSRPLLYRPRLVGRSDVFDRLRETARRASQRDGAMVVLRGESGVGKTFLALETARALDGTMRPIVGRCEPPLPGVARASSPFQPLRAALQHVANLCLAGGADVTDRLVGPHGKVLAPHEPALRDLPGQSRFAEPAPLDGIAARDRLLASMRSVLAALAEHEPALLLLDDLQWADELTLRLIETLPPGWIAERALLILGTCRSDASAATASSILARPDVETIELEGVDERSLTMLIADMLAVRTPPADLGRFLAVQSRGNPFYVAEYLRAGLAEGVLHRASPDSVWIGDAAAPTGASLLDSLALPTSIREIILHRLARLHADSRRLLAVASIFGRDFDVEIAREISAMESASCLDAVRELLGVRMIEQTGPASCRFAHDSLLEVVHAETPPEDRRAWHRLAAHTFEARHRREPLPPGFAARLARHWELAGEPSRELAYRDVAGDEALAAAAFEEASAHWRRGLELADAGPSGTSGTDWQRRVKWHFGIARAAHALGDIGEAERRASRALAQTGYRVPESTFAWTRLLVTQASSQLLGGGARLRRPGSSSQRAALLDAARAADLLTHRFFYDEDVLAMLATASLAANLARRGGDLNVAPRAFLALAFAAELMRLPGTAARYLATAEGAGAGRLPAGEQAYLLASISVYHATFGRWQAAESAADRASGMLDAVADPFVVEVVLTTRGHVEYFTGRYAAAHDTYVAVRESAHARGNLQHDVWGRFSMARSLHALGHYADAVPLLEGSLDDLARAPELQSEITCLGLLAWARLRLGDRDAARRAADDALSRIARARPNGFPTIEGCTTTADTYDELIASGTDAHERRTLERCLHASLKGLRRFASLIPMARPAVDLRNARDAARRQRYRAGRASAARTRRLAPKSVASGKKALPGVMLIILTTEPVSRDAHLERARSLLDAIGTPHLFHEHFPKDPR